jgi:hypothetical protein
MGFGPCGGVAAILTIVATDAGSMAAAMKDEGLTATAEDIANPI